MRRRFATACATATLGLAAVAVLSSLEVAGPVIAHDEYDYLSIARALIGRGRLLEIPAFGSHPWGYPLVIAPLAAILDSARSLHLGALILNGLLLAALVPLGVATLKRLGFAPWTALGGALLVATHPSLFTYAHLAFSENLFVPLQALALLTLVAVVDGRSAGAAIGLGVVLAACPFVRFNGVATLVAGALVLAALTIGRESRRPALVALAALAAAAGGFTALEQLLLPDFRFYSGLSRTSFLASALHNPALFLQTLAGQFVSISLSSWLLFPILLTAAAHQLFRTAHRPRRPPEGWQAGVVFAAAAAFGTLLMSAILLHGEAHFEIGVWARYGEGSLALLVWGGLVGMRETRSRSLAALLSFGVLVLLAFIAPPLGDRPPMEVIAAPALFHPLHAWGLRSVPLVTVITGAPMVAAWWMLGRGWRAVAAVSVALQLAVGLDIVATYVVPGSRFRQKQSAYLTGLEPIGMLVKRIALLEVEVSGRTEGSLSYALPQAEILRVRTAQEALLYGAQVVIAGKDQAGTVPSDYRLVALQWRGPLATWVHRDIDVRSEQGTTLHEIALPPDNISDRRAALTVSGPVRVESGRLRLRVRVTNTGGDYFPDRGVLIQSPWPMAPVRVGLAFRDDADRPLAEDRLDLPQPLYSGQHVDVEGDVPVPQGAATLIVRLLQEERSDIGAEQRYPLDDGSP